MIGIFFFKFRTPKRKTKKTKCGSVQCSRDKTKDNNTLKNMCGDKKNYSSTTTPKVQTKIIIIFNLYLIYTKKFNILFYKITNIFISI